MTHFKWLKKEIPRWVKEEIITREAGDSLISLYRNEERHSHGEGLFVLAAVCFLTGLIFVCAGIWNSLSQDEQFMMALVPLVLSILIIAGILWQDRFVMDRDPAENDRLKVSESAAETLPGETGETVSSANGISEYGFEMVQQRERKKMTNLFFFLPFLTGTAYLMSFGKRPAFFTAWRFCAPYGW